MQNVLNIEEDVTPPKSTLLRSCMVNRFTLVLLVSREVSCDTSATNLRNNSIFPCFDGDLSVCCPDCHISL